MGFLRIALAIIVFIHHREIVGSWISGSVAVVIFFVISGFYIQMVLKNKYTEAKLGSNWRTRFYLSRYTRLYPAYVISILIAVVFNQIPEADFYSPQGWISIVPNLFMLGLNVPSSSYVINMPGWSIGIEIAFYIVAPFILTKSDKLLYLFVAFGVVLRFVPYNSHLPLLPSIDLFMFGALAYRHREMLTLPEAGSRIQRQVAVYVIIVLVLSFSVPSYDLFSVAGAHNETDMLFYPIVTAFLLPTLFAWSHEFPLDRQIGDLSYPFYIVHWIVTGILVRYLPDAYVTFMGLLVIFMLAITMNYIEHRWIEPRRALLSRSGLPFSTPFSKRQVT